MRRSTLGRALLLLFLFSVAIPIQARIITVPDDEATIQAGIDAAASGDTVLVLPGNYFENINFSGKDILLTSEFLTTGTLSSVLATVIDGSQASDAANASVVTFNSGEIRSAVLQGFMITGGAGTNWVDSSIPDYLWRSGGGVIMLNSSPILRNNCIYDNHVVEMAGIDGASGGGLLSYGGNPAIVRNIIANNSAVYGGGVVMDYSGARIKNNLIIENHAGSSYGGGGYWAIGSNDNPVIMENCTIVGNSSETDGGGIRLFDGEMTVRNSIIWGNTQSSGGPVFGGSIDLSFCDIEGGWMAQGNINEDPLFADDLYHLSSGSPCVDGGDPAVSYNDRVDESSPEDPAWPALGTLENDMGAYGGPGSLRYSESSMNLGVLPRSESPSNFKLFRSYPNPFNSSTRIEFALSKESRVIASIFDIQGRYVCKLIDRQVQPGRHTFGWDGRNSAGQPVSSGIYLYAVATSETYQTGRLVFLR